MNAHNSHVGSRTRSVEVFLGLLFTTILVLLSTACAKKLLAKSKTAEAKTTVAGIARAAIAAFEKKKANAKDKTATKNLKLCGSASPVPSSVLKGKRYQPAQTDGEDFKTGDDQTGWRCIRFELQTPHYYQYHYGRDGSPVAPKNPKACKSDCFEAGAIGDLDGDGDLSRFALVGQVDRSKMTIKLSELYIDQEAE